MNTRLIFVLLYVLVDVTYVFASKSVYERAVKVVAGLGFPSGRFVVMTLAWACMALGWYLLAAPAALRWKAQFGAPLAGALAGLVYGLTVLGTFNFTLAGMFKGWYGSIVIRDILWGVSWAAVSLSLYTIAENKF